MSPGFSAVFDDYRGLPRSIYVIFVSRIVNSMGAFVWPFLAIYLTTNLGIGEAQAGLISTISIFVHIPGSILGGYLTDSIGRKNIIIASMGLSALMYVPCAFLSPSMTIPVLLILSSFFMGASDPAASAMVADLTEPKNRKASFSLIYLGINIGFSLGPLIAGFLYNDYIELIFLGDALTTFISIVVIYLYVEETMPCANDIEKTMEGRSYDERPEEGSLFHVICRRPYLFAFAFISLILWFVFSQMSFSLPLYMKDIFGIERGPQLFGILMSVNGMVVVIMTIFLIALTKRFRPILNVALSGVLGAFGFLMYSLTSNFTLFIAATALWTFGEILDATNSGVYIANHTPVSHRGRFNAIINIIRGAGGSINPLFMGLFIEMYSLRMVWPFVFVLGMIGSGLMFMLYILEKRKAEKTECVSP